MTLPAAPNPIDFAQVNVEKGAAVGAALDFSWIHANSNSNAGSATLATPIDNLGGLRGLAYYQRVYSQPSDKKYIQGTGGCDCNCNCVSNCCYCDCNANCCNSCDCG